MLDSVNAVSLPKPSFWSSKMCIKIQFTILQVIKPKGLRLVINYSLLGYREFLLLRRVVLMLSRGSGERLNRL